MKILKDTNNLKNGFLNSKILLGLLGLLILGAGGFYLIQNKDILKKTNLTNNNNTQNQTNLKEKETKKNQATKQINIDKNKYNEIISLNSSTGEKKSNIFTLKGGEQKLTYSYDKKNEDYSCTVYLLPKGEKPNGFPDVLKNNRTNNDSNSIILHKKEGEYFMLVRGNNTNCKATLYQAK